MKKLSNTAVDGEDHGSFRYLDSVNKSNLNNISLCIYLKLRHLKKYKVAVTPTSVKEIKPIQYVDGVGRLRPDPFNL